MRELRERSFNRVPQNDQDLRHDYLRRNGSWRIFFPKVGNARFAYRFFVPGTLEKFQIVRPFGDRSASWHAGFRQFAEVVGEIREAQFFGEKIGLLDRAHVDFRMLAEVVVKRCGASFWSAR